MPEAAAEVRRVGLVRLGVVRQEAEELIRVVPRPGVVCLGVLTRRSADGGSEGRRRGECARLGLAGAALHNSWGHKHLHKIGVAQGAPKPVHFLFNWGGSFSSTPNVLACSLGRYDPGFGA